MLNLDYTCRNTLIGYQGCFDSITLKVGMDVVDSIEECIKSCTVKYNYAGIMNGYIKFFYFPWLIFFILLAIYVIVGMIYIYHH